MKIESSQFPNLHRDCLMKTPQNSEPKPGSALQIVNSECLAVGPSGTIASIPNNLHGVFVFFGRPQNIQQKDGSKTTPFVKPVLKMGIKWCFLFAVSKVILGQACAEWIPSRSEFTHLSRILEELGLDQAKIQLSSFALLQVIWINDYSEPLFFF